MEKGLLDFFKIRQKQGIDFKPFQIFKPTRSVLCFTMGIGNPFESVHRKFMVASCLNIYSQGEMKQASRCL